MSISVVSHYAECFVWVVFIPRVTQWGRDYCYPYFTDEETEARKVQEIVEVTLFINSCVGMWAQESHSRVHSFNHCAALLQKLVKPGPCTQETHIGDALNRTSHPVLAGRCRQSSQSVREGECLEIRHHFRETQSGWSRSDDSPWLLIYKEGIIPLFRGTAKYRTISYSLGKGATWILGKKIFFCFSSMSLILLYVAWFCVLVVYLLTGL